MASPFSAAKRPGSEEFSWWRPGRALSRPLPHLGASPRAGYELFGVQACICSTSDRTVDRWMRLDVDTAPGPSRAGFGPGLVGSAALVRVTAPRGGVCTTSRVVATASLPRLTAPPRLFPSVTTSSHRSVDSSLTSVTDGACPGARTLDTWGGCLNTPTCEKWFHNMESGPSFSGGKASTREELAGCPTCHLAR